MRYFNARRLQDALRRRRLQRDVEDALLMLVRRVEWLAPLARHEPLLGKLLSESGFQRIAVHAVESETPRGDSAVTRAYTDVRSTVTALGSGGRISA